MQLKIKKCFNCIMMTMMTLCLCACTARSSSVVESTENSEQISDASADNHVSFEAENSEAESKDIEISYAKGFTIKDMGNDNYLITIGEQKIASLSAKGEENDATIPSWVNDDMTVVTQDISNLYMAASSGPDMIDTLGQLSKVAYTSTTYEDWALPSMKAALESGDITYVGKYRAPDYEFLLANGCDLVIESTMINHSPEVYEKFEQLGIPVMIEYSSYENTPLGRMEWVKVYGALLGCLDTAEQIFLENVEKIEALSISSTEKKSVAFFYINSNGSVVVRKPGDYVSNMIEMAGGEYIIKSVPSEENALSTMNMQMEAFYAEAIDADILIYNSTIDGEITSIRQLLEKSELLKDFKAVKEGRVWCTGKNMFQETGSMAEMIVDMNKVISLEEKSEEELTYLHYLEEE